MLNRTRQLAENALMLALSTVLLLLNTYTILGAFAMVVLPVPFILLGARRTVRDMALIVATYAFLGLILTGLMGMLPAVAMALAGAVMGFLYKRWNSALPAVVGGSAVLLVSSLVSLVVLTYVLHVDVLDTFKKTMQQFVEQSASLPLAPGMTREQLKQEIQLQINQFLLLFPAGLVISSLMAGACNHWLARLISSRTGHPLPPLKPLREWSFPRSLLYYYFVTLLLMLIFGRSLGETFWAKALVNLRVMLDFVFLLQGMSLVLLFGYRKGWKRVTPVLVVSLFIFPLLANILSLLGIFDLGVGLRKRLETRK